MSKTYSRSKQGMVYSLGGAAIEDIYYALSIEGDEHKCPTKV